MNGDTSQSAPRRVTVVVDNETWILPWARTLVARIRQETDHDAVLVRSYEDIDEGVAAVFMGCLGIASPSVLARNRYNLVPHASALPHGRGFAPLAWQILAGVNEIPVSLIEAVEGADQGPIYFQEVMRFAGHELHDELRSHLGATCVKLCMAFFLAPAPPAPQPQSGTPSWYRRRTPADSELDPYKSLAEQFQLLRTVDNERYPAFFRYRGHTYILRIEKSQSAEDRDTSNDE